MTFVEEDARVETEDAAIDVDLFALSTEANPETWESRQTAENATQLSNKQESQLEQIELMKRRLAELEKDLMAQHAEQQEMITAIGSAPGARACLNDDGKCNPMPTCLSAEV